MSEQQPQGFEVPIQPSPVVTESPGLLGAALPGAAAAVAGAVIWAAVTVATKFQIGFMAIGIGVLVALTVRKFGAPTQQHALMSGALSLVGCALGNLFSACAIAANQNSSPLFDVLGRVLTQPQLIAYVMRETFQPMDALFYAIAAYEGYKLVLRVRR
jgi:hypothetical protein